MSKPRSPNPVAPRRSKARMRPRTYDFSSFGELARKDFLSSLSLWLMIEVASFLLLPAMMGINFGDRLQTWFSLSIPLGVGGAFLLGASSRFVALTNDRESGSNKRSYVTLGQVAGVLGFLGIMFPFFMVAREFFARILES